MNVLVRDAQNTARWKYPYHCSCKSWIEHWRNNSIMREPDICPRRREPITEENYLVGAHVQKVQEIWGEVDKNYYYIIPICNSCNSSGNFLLSWMKTISSRSKKEFSAHKN